MGCAGFFWVNYENWEYDDRGKTRLNMNLDCPNARSSEVFKSPMVEIHYKNERINYFAKFPSPVLYIHTDIESL